MNKKPPLQNQRFKWWEHVTNIAAFLCKDPTTISKEVRAHRLSDWYHKGTFYNSKNFCIHRYHCKKTYASAFAMRELGFQRALFLVHRNQIAKQAKKSFRKVFSGQVSMGLVTGKYQEYGKDFIFATIQTLSKEENLHRYEKNAFDAIIIDEAHHSAANSYKKVLDYFEPKLWLAMTATPDKRDDFGYSGDRVKGLIFCSRIDETKELSKKFNAKGWRTLVLGGSYEDGYDDAYDYWEEEMDYKI